MDYVNYIVEEFKEIVSIPSPSGYTRAAAQATAEKFRAMGYKAELTRKGGVIIEFGGESEEAIMLAAHLDTLGAMVCEVKGNGALRMTRLGGFNANNVEAENCAVHTRDGKVFSGTIQLANPSIHVNLKYDKTERTFDTIEVVLDEKVYSKKDTEALGIGVGDFICIDPKVVYTETGFLKSRFLDDKLSVAVLLGLGKYMKDNNLVPKQKLYGYITVYEEIGHGASANIPADVADIISVDMGCVGDGLACKETQVSICVKDSSGPSDFLLTNALIECAKKNNVDYAIDVYPGYGSDADAALRAGYDMRHCVIGQGVFASHGYERTHRDGIKATFDLLKAFVI